MADVETKRIRGQRHPHGIGDDGHLTLHEKVEVVVHQAPCDHPHSIRKEMVDHEAEEVLTIVVILEDELPTYAPSGQMIEP